jgi:hypothetical protein
MTRLKLVEDAHTVGVRASPDAFAPINVWFLPGPEKLIHGSKVIRFGTDRVVSRPPRVLATTVISSSEQLPVDPRSISRIVEEIRLLRLT